MATITKKSSLARAERRDRIRSDLLGAVEELLRDGESFVDLRLESIASAAGVSRSTFYVYFADKGELLQGWLDDIFDEVAAGARRWYRLPANATQSQVRQVLAEVLQAYRRHAGLMSAVADAAAYDHTIRDELTAHMNRQIDGLASYISSGQTTGAINPSLPAADTASWIVWMAERGLHQLMRNISDDRAAELIDGFHAIVWNTLYGQRTEVEQDLVTADASPSLTAEGRYGAESVAQFRKQGWWRDGSAAALLDHWADTTPDRCFVSDGVVDLDYGTVRRRAHGLGAALLRRGVKPGQRVVVQLPNWAEFVISYMAISRIGAVFVPIMPVYRQHEVGHVLDNSAAVAAITTGVFRKFDHLKMFRGLMEEAPALHTLVVARGEPAEGELDFDRACSTETDDAELGFHPDPDAPHVIVYTSGTESTAKGCLHTWNTLAFSGRGLADDVFEITADDVVFMPSPVSHATGLVVGVLAPLAVGAESHLLDVWEPKEGLRRIEQYRCTATATATPFVRMALDAAPAAGCDLSSMRFWLCAGAPIPQALAREFAEVFTHGVLNPLYGASEIMAGACCHRGDPIERRSGSDGSAALDGVRIELLGPDGELMPVGDEGEICYWGPGAILGYWRDPERTAATIDEKGWHHTGDLGRKDAEGYLRVTGRLKDIIIRGGTNISASEVESHVAAHPDVAQVAVVAYPDERLGEKACAVVVPVAGRKPTLTNITDFLRTRSISNQKLPERLVLVEELPMTATGKVQKFQLRDIARNGA